MILLILAALEELKYDKDINPKRLALSFIKQLKMFKFILMIIIFNEIFKIISPLSKYFQSSNIDFFQTVTFIDHTLRKIRIMQIRDENNSISWNNILLEAKLLAEKWNIDQFLENKRKRVVKKMPGENCCDEIVSDSLKKFQCETFFIIIDSLETKFQSDFKESKDIVKDMSIFQIDKM